MADKTEPVEKVDEVAELRQRAEDAEARSNDLEEAVEVLNSMVGDYQQNLADAQLTAATFKAKLSNAQRKLAAAAAAQ